jgi:DNA-binding beta-propeller fold protein YncE
MHRLFCLLALALAFNVPAHPPDGHYLYLSTPDGAQPETKSGNGILVFDIDQGHRFVRRIDLPVFQEGLRGFLGSLKRHAVFYTTTNQRMGCFDLESEKVLWEKTYPRGCDRACITPDGRKLYVPTGWWYKGEDSGVLVVDAGTGDLIKRVHVGTAAHNSIVTLDGSWMLLGTDTLLTVFDTATDNVLRQIKDVGESGVFPFTFDSRNKLAYVCLGKHVGFDIVDLQRGTVLDRVLAGESPIAHRTHGIALTPDETELWVSDQEGKRLFIYDATQMPPKVKGQVELSVGGHGWVTFSLDGRHVWTHTPDVFDAHTRRQVATLRDENGKPVGSSKFFEVRFREGKVVEVGDQFGLGRKSIPN